MKKKIYSKTIAALIAVMMFTSCTDLFNKQDIKTNPNAPFDAPIDVLLSGTEVGMAVSLEDSDTRIAAMWGGQLLGQSRQQAGFQIYNVTAATFDNGWFLVYETGANARIIQDKASALNNKVALGIAQVIEAMLMTKIASFYGDVPYSQAWDVVKYPKPVFDKQLDVYAALVSLLDAAYANLTSGIGGVGGSSADFIYGGDGTKWAAAAKTLQARLYMHLKDYPNALAAAALGIASKSDDALIPHGNSQTIDQNLNYDMFNNSRPGDTGFDLPAYLPLFMRTRYDGVAQPLVPIVTTAKGDTILSSTARQDDVTKRQFAATRNSLTDETALYNHFFQFDIYTPGGLDPNTVDGNFQSNSSHPMLTYYENQLIIAEAHARTGAIGNIPAAVTALNKVRTALATGYINGGTISATNQSLGIQYDPYAADGSDFAVGGLADAGKGSTQANILYEIIGERLAVMILQFETFNDLRRMQVATPVVTLPIPVNGPVAKGWPARFIYSQNEINTNPDNVPGAKSGGVADVYVKLPVFQ